MENKFRFLSTLLSVILIFSFMPLIGFANDNTSEEQIIIAESNEDMDIDIKYRDAKVRFNGKGIFYKHYLSGDDYFGNENSEELIEEIEVTYEDKTEKYHMYTQYYDDHLYSYFTNEDATDYIYFNISPLWYDSEADRYWRWSSTSPAIPSKAEVYFYKDSSDSYDYDLYAEAEIPIDFYSEVTSISFEPSKISLYSEDIKEVEGDEVYYNFYNRNKHKYPNGDEVYDAFVVGDKFSMTLNDRSTRTYECKEVQDTSSSHNYSLKFIRGNDTSDALDFEIEGGWAEGGYDLAPGENKLKVWCHGVSTIINVYLETPESRARTKAVEAARNALDEAKRINESYPVEARSAVATNIKVLEDVIADSKKTAAEINSAITALNNSVIAAENAKAEAEAKAKAEAEAKAKAEAEAEALTVIEEESAESTVKVGDTKKYKSNKYKVLSVKSKKVAFTQAKNSKSIIVPASIKIDGETYKVTQINASAFKAKKIRNVTIGKNVKVVKKNAFKGSKATKLILKTKLLKKAKVKGSLKGSKIKTVQVKVGTKKQNKTYVKKYKKYFTKANVGRKVTVK